VKKLLKRDASILLGYAVCLGVFYVLGYKLNAMMVYTFLTGLITGEIINFALSKREK
jgi:putative flippase GtrA